MISPAYITEMTAYNTWQNNGLRRVVQAMDDADVRADRGAFFGSIFGTLNHLLWGDLLWMSRFDGGPAQSPVIADSAEFTATVTQWAEQRVRADTRISSWASGVTKADLSGDITWFSGSLNAEVARPKVTCITHFFNHQTHHRGQLHAMLTAAGQTPDATDLVFMLKD
ncbi:MAG: damage-inducible protein DinB [Yoonia sp.]|nr:damage-inducible protein DinB [Yoonia sp.]